MCDQTNPLWTSTAGFSWSPSSVKSELATNASNVVFSQWTYPKVPNVSELTHSIEVATLVGPFLSEFSLPQGSELLQEAVDIIYDERRFLVLGYNQG